MGRSRSNPDDELADAIERAWLTRWGSVPVVAQVVLEKLRKGGR